MKAPLPARDGVGPTRLRLPSAGPWPTIADHVAERFTHLDGERLRARFPRGDFVDITGTPVTGDEPLGSVEFIWYYREPPAREHDVPLDFDVLHHDDDLLVIDKPHFLPTTPGGSFLVHSALIQARRRFGNDDLVPIHRLDRATAGVLMFSARPETRGLYQSMFERREVRKVYRAVTEIPDAGLPSSPWEYRSHIRKFRDNIRVQVIEGEEPNAITRAEVIGVGARAGAFASTGTGAPAAHVRLFPLTGQMHQLRVHLAAQGMGILGDRYYPDLFPLGDDDRDRPLQLLAEEVSFTDPRSASPRTFRSRRTLTAIAPG